MAIQTTRLVMDEGDTRRIVADFTGSAAPFDDLAGATVTLYLKPRDPPGGATTQVSGIVDAAGSDGKAHTCRSDSLSTLTAGEYLATMVVAHAGEEERTSRWLRVDDTAAP